MTLMTSNDLHGRAPRHQASDHDDGVGGVHRVLVVEDAEAETRLALGQLDLLHVPGPGGRVREDLQRPRPGHHALPDNVNVGKN